MNISLSPRLLFHPGGARKSSGILVFAFLFSISLAGAFGQDSVSRAGDKHELTIFVIPSVAPLDWSSPASLHKSFFKGYFARLLHREKFLIGHLFIRLNSPLLDKPLFTGMQSASKKEKRRLVMKEKVGLAILGMSLTGQLEDTGSMQRRIKYYARRNEIAFVTYQVNQAAVKRILEFYKIFTARFNDKYSPYNFYGGAFWPLYEYEGAGCTAYGMAMLQLADLLGKETDDWKVDVNIPMQLVGGELNNHKKIAIRTIRATHQWHPGTGTAGKDFIPFYIYDPSLVYRWIHKHRQLRAENLYPDYQPVEENGIPGLSSDRRFVEVSDSVPIIKSRPTENLFINHFYIKAGINK